MARLDELTDDIAERFDLGPKAPALVQEVLGLISAQPGGIGGFLNKVEAADFEEKVASWVGSPYPMALSVAEVKKALGAEAIKTIAKNAELTENFACKVLGYAIPETISLLAADGAFPRATSATSPSGGGDSTFERDILMHQMAGAGAPTEFRLVVPGAALLITLGLVGYFIKSGTAGDLASVQFPSSVSVAQNAPAAASQTPSQLLPGNETTASGENATGATTGPQKQALGSGQTAGDFAVKAGWIQNLRAASGGLGSHVQFAGTGLNEEATRALGNRTWRIGSLWRAEVPQFVVATLTGSGPARISLASPAPALASSGTEFSWTFETGGDSFPNYYFPAQQHKGPIEQHPPLAAGCRADQAIACWNGGSNRGLYARRGQASRQCGVVAKSCGLRLPDPCSRRGEPCHVERQGLRQFAVRGQQ